MTVYQIAKWSSTFENAASRKLKTLTWISMPVGFNSTGYHQLLEEFEDEAPAIYGAWCALCTLAATCSKRGVLANSKGEPLKVSHISRVTGFPEVVFKRLIDWASSPDVEWLIEFDPLEESVSALAESTDELADCQSILPSTQPDLTRPDRTRQNTTQQTEPYPMEVWMDEVKKSHSEGGLKKTALDLANRFNRIPSTIFREAVDDDMILQVSWVCAAFDKSVALECVCKLRKNEVKKPKSYINTIMQNLCKKFEQDWEKLRYFVPDYANKPPPVQAAG